MFKDADVIVFIGGFPRKKGMERKDLLDMNKKIFVEQSKALSAAKKTVKCVVVANPANTNAYILSHFNPSIPKENITCLTRLDHNRAISQLMLKTNSRPEEIKGVMIFGNHSLTQYPGVNNLKIKGKEAKDVIEK
jgi:malate dehydrogenase